MLNPVKTYWPESLPINISMLLISVILVCMPHFVRMPVLLTALCFILILWRILHETKGLPLPGRFVRLLILLFSLYVLFTIYSTLIGRSAGSAMLVLMLALKLLELNKNRDVVVVLYISFFVVITGFLFDQSILSGVYMLFTVWILIATMITYNHPVETSLPNSGYLKRHFRLSSILLLQSLPLMIFLFFLFPRIPGPLWGMPEESGGAATGLSDTLEPGRISQLSDNPEVAFRVKFEGLAPLPNKLYWRGPVLTKFDGVRWRVAESDPLPRLNLDDITRSRPVDYVVTLEPHNQNWLFALEIPANIPDNSKLSNDLQLLSNTPVRSVTRYKMRSYINYHYDTQSVLNLEQALYLPDGSSPKTREFVHSLQTKYHSQSKLVNAILQHFRNEPFYYTRKPPKLYGDITDEFLFETQRGYCVHYASAFAVMMRIAGIPARIISGYQGAEENPLSDYMIVRQSDAHSWVEIWIAKLGWMRIDPTSVIPEHRIENTEDILRRQPDSSRKQFMLKQGFLSQSLFKLRYALDAVNNRWNLWVVGYDHKKQDSIFASFGLDKLSLSKHTLYMTGIVLLLIFITSLLVFKKKRKKITIINAAYQRFCKKLARCGFEKLAQESATDFAKRVISKRDDLQADILFISKLYNHLRYAPVPKPALLGKFQSKIRHFHPSKHKPI